MVLKVKIGLSEDSKRYNGSNVSKSAYLRMHEFDKKGESYSITDSEDAVLNSILVKGYADFNELGLPQVDVKFTEYSPSYKEIAYVSCCRPTKEEQEEIRERYMAKHGVPIGSIPTTSAVSPIKPVQSHSTDTEPTKPSQNSTSTNTVTNTATNEQTARSSSSPYGGRYDGETPEESEIRKLEERARREEKDLAKVMRCNFNKFQQYQTLLCTFTTDAKHQTTNIKEFAKRLDDCMNKLSEKLKSVTVTHKSKEMCRTYSYEHFTVISVISCTLRGYLHAHCLFIFEGCITKIASQVNKNGSIGFNADDNPIKDCWEYGNVNFKHFLGTNLGNDDIVRETQYFCNNYQAIRVLKRTRDNDLRILAEEKIQKYVDKYRHDLQDELKDYISKKSLDANQIKEMKALGLLEEDKPNQVEQLIEECYTNLYDLKQQQAKGLRNRLVKRSQKETRAVQPEDLTKKMSQGAVNKYIDGMTLVDQDVYCKFIYNDYFQEWSLQISILSKYLDDSRTYDNSVNMFSRYDYRNIVNRRREPVLLDETPVKKKVQPTVTPPVDVPQCVEDSYIYMNDVATETDTPEEYVDFSVYDEICRINDEKYYTPSTDEWESLLEDDYALDDGYYDSVPLGDDEEVQSLYADEDGYVDYFNAEPNDTEEYVNYAVYDENCRISNEQCYPSHQQADAPKEQHSIDQMNEIEVEEYYQSNKEDIDLYWLANKKPLYNADEQSEVNDLQETLSLFEWASADEMVFEIGLRIDEIDRIACERYWKAHKIDIIKEYCQSHQQADAPKGQVLDGEPYVPNEQQSIDQMSEIEVEEYYQSNKKEIDEYWLANKKPLLDNEEKDYFNEYYKKYYRTESAPVEVTLEIVKIYEKGCERYWKAHKIDIIKEYYQQSQDDAEGFLPDELFF
jgi:hypothetical protein